MIKNFSTIHIKYFILICNAIWTLTSCENDLPASQKRLKTSLIYMVADNNLDYFAVRNINEIENAFHSEEQGRIIIYVDRSKSGKPSHPYLLEVVHDSTSLIASKIIRIYPEQNSCDKNIFRNVINDVVSYCGNKFELYGLVLWSHGSAWLPENAHISSNEDKSSSRIREKTIPTNSFGLDIEDSTKKTEENYNELDIEKMAASLTGLHFRYLIFDACFMGSIEVAYELRNFFDYIVASPTEILSSGFPYKDITNELTKTNFNPLNITSAYFDYYNSKSKTLQSGAIVAINTQNLSKLSAFFKELTSKKTTELSENALDTLNLFQYDRSKSDWFYDIKEITQNIISKTDFSRFETILSTIIIDYKHTNTIFSTLCLDKSNGLSIYLPQKNETRKKINEYYKTLSWFNDSGFNDLASNL